MPSRRRFLAACSAIGLAGVPASVAGETTHGPSSAAAGASTDPAVASAEPAETSANPAERPADRHGVAPSDTVDAFRTVGDRLFGRVDLGAARRLRDAAPTLDRASDLDRRLAPVLGRGRDAPAGLRSLSGNLDPDAVLRRLRRRATVERLGVAGDHSVYATATDGGRATVGTDGADLLVDGGDAAAAATIAGEDAGLAPAAATVVDGLRDAAAFTGATVAADAAAAFDRGDPARAMLPGVAAFGIGVDADGGRPVLRARVVSADDEPLSVDAVRTVLGAVGVPDDLLAAGSTRTDGRVVDVHAPLPRREETQPAVALLFLVIAVAVLGTFVLGLGTSVNRAGSGSGSSRRRPQVALDFDSRSDGRVTITHHGGDTIQSEVAVRYTSDGRRVTETWNEADDIAAGDSYTTEDPVDDGTEVSVVWLSDDGTAVLGEYEA